MEQRGGYQATIEKLYDMYNKNGFINEEVAHKIMTADNVSLVGINRIIDKLLALGVVFVTETSADDEDYTQTDYESLYNDVLKILPNKKQFIEYLREIRPPQRKEWRELLIQYQSGNKYAYNRLFEMYLRVVVKIAMYYDYGDTGIFDLDDAIQEGTLGLGQAIVSYNLSQHGYFSAYVTNWIRQRIDRAIADTKRTVRIPVYLQENINPIKEMIDELYQRYGREPSANEIEKEFNLSYERITLIQNLLKPTVSFEEIRENENGGSVVYLEGIINDNVDSANALEDEAPLPFAVTEHSILKELLNDVLGTLTYREGRVLKLRFGLIDGKQRTLEEVGQIFDVTRERIRQIEAKALRKLRHPSRSKKLRDFLD